MATTQLSNLIVPEIFASYMLEDSLQKNALIQSGLVVQNPMISSFLAGGGLTFNLPAFEQTDASATAANVSTDNIATLATPEGMLGRAQIAVRSERNKAWSSSYLTASVAGADPLAAALTMSTNAIMKWRQATLVSTIQGVMGVAGLSGNVNSIANEDNTAISSSTEYSSGGLIDSTAGFSDMSIDQSGASILMHPDVYRYLSKNDFTSFNRLSGQDYGFGTYLGMPVLVDATVGKRAGTTSGSVYTIYIIKSGVINFGYTQHAMPVQIFPVPLGGAGGGGETLSVRDIFSWHIKGMAFNSASVAGNLPTDAELANEANWTLALQAKGVGIAAFVFNLPA